MQLLTRNLLTGHKNADKVIWEGEPRIGETRRQEKHILHPSKFKSVRDLSGLPKIRRYNPAKLKGSVFMSAVDPLAQFRPFMYESIAMLAVFAILIMFAELIFAMIQRIVIEFFKDIGSLFGRPRISDAAIRRQRKYRR